MSKRKILIDCDPGHDDAVAILYAARHLDLVGITTVHGNNTVENTTRNALAILELAGLDVPLASWAAPSRWRNAGSRAAAVHGKGGLDGADLPEPKRRPVDMHAVDFIIDMAARHRGDLVLATIGPETNVALALRREPRLRDWLQEITVMGGSTGPGNITPAAEFNIYCDPEAAWAVFNSGIPIRMVGLNVTRRTGFDQADIDRMKASGRKVACIGRRSHGVLSRAPARAARPRRGADARRVRDRSLRRCNFARVCAHPGRRGAQRHPHARHDAVRSAPCALVGCPTIGPAANARVAVDAKSRALIERVIDTLLAYD